MQKHELNDRLCESESARGLQCSWYLQKDYTLIAKTLLVSSPPIKVTVSDRERGSLNGQNQGTF